MPLKQNANSLILNDTKKCTKCKQTKPIDDFHKDSNRSDGTQAKCKQCDRDLYEGRRARLGKKAYSRKPPIKTKPGHRKCRRCKSVFEKNHYLIDGSLKTNCLSCREYLDSDEFKAIKRIQQRKAVDKFRAANPDKIKQTYRNWADMHKRENHERRMRDEPGYALRWRMRDMLARTLKRSGGKKTTRTEQMMGYTASDLRNHLESLFQPEMTWANRGEWHIDHIKPIVQFIKEGVADPAEINALSNLQPLWATDNLSKGARW